MKTFTAAFSLFAIFLVTGQAAFAETPTYARSALETLAGEDAGRLTCASADPSQRPQRSVVIDQDQRGPGAFFAARIETIDDGSPQAKTTLLNADGFMDAGKADLSLFEEGSSGATGGELSGVASGGGTLKSELRWPSGKVEDLICRYRKPDGFPPPYTCMAYWTGYVYDETAGSCVRRGRSGCSNPYQYQTLESCQAAHGHR